MWLCENLPVFALRERIVSAYREHGAICLSAPPGSGKSTCVPLFLAEYAGPGRIVVLEPRRLAARHLAAFCARMLGEGVGGTVGYEVRFDAAVSRQTRIVFQTYGVFVRRLLAQPLADGITAVVLDEFHERTLDTDLALAWLKRLRQERPPGPGLVVMSATIGGSAVADYLGSAPLIEASGHRFPVEVCHQRPRPFESSEQQAARALAGLVDKGTNGSVLVFMPGVAEIRRTAELIAPLCRRVGLPLYELHGRMRLDEQVGCVSESARRPVAIIATNVAETSITIPGVTTVIDCGYERRMSFDPGRNRNALYRGLISRASAAQRAGRAGRTAPGRCIRLYAAETEQAMQECSAPEITRLELSRPALASLGLCDRAGMAPIGDMFLPWLTPPDTERWTHALQTLAAIGATVGTRLHTRLTERGRNLLAWPTDPVPAAILTDASAREVAILSCAVIALWEHNEPGPDRDLFAPALELAVDRGSRDVPPEVKQSFDALRAGCEPEAAKRERAVLLAASGDISGGKRTTLRRKLAACWMRPCAERVGVRQAGSSSYAFADGSTAVLEKPSSAQGHEYPEALLALDILVTGGAGHATRRRITQYLALQTEWIREELPDRVTTTRGYRWDEHTQAVSVVEETRLGALVLERRRLEKPNGDPRAAEILAGKLESGEIVLTDQEAEQLVRRIRVAAGAFPDAGFPVLDAADWKTIYRAFAAGKASRAELERGSLAAAIRARLGPALCSRLDLLTPVKVRLASGRTGRVTYFDNAPPELSARIGDFVGTRGPFTVCDGRVRGVYDILAPNMRTVQKTADLDGFWKNAYPKIRAELMRRYPRHPWP